MKQNAGDHKCAWIENVKAKRKDINSCKFLKNLQEFYQILHDYFSSTLDIRNTQRAMYLQERQGVIGGFRASYASEAVVVYFSLLRSVMVIVLPSTVMAPAASISERQRMSENFCMPKVSAISWRDLSR